MRAHIIKAICFILVAFPFVVLIAHGLHEAHLNALYRYVAW